MKKKEKLEKAASKRAEAQLKATNKAARKLVKDKKKASAQFKWSEESCLELLFFVRMVHEEHLDGQDHIGFVKFAKFFSSRDVPLDYFPLLAGIDHEALLRRYWALLGLYRVSLTDQ